MDIRGQDRSRNFEDRGVGRGGGGGGGGGLPVALIFMLMRRLGLKGSLVVGAIGAVAYFFLPAGARQLLLGQAGMSTAGSAPAGGSACELSKGHSSACDFSRVVLASTEQVWHTKFRQALLPNYGTEINTYREPTLVVFSRAVATQGCGSATSAVGPFYCPADEDLYIDPDFYQTMSSKLKAPGDFAQAYVIAHEVGHHVQNLIGSSRIKGRGDTKNQASVRVELQADCLAGVWGNSARSRLKITEDDLQEALQAAHSIGDDSLGHSDEDKFTHGTSQQRVRWFRRGFDGGDPRQCDTFAGPYAQL